MQQLSPTRRLFITVLAVLLLVGLILGAYFLGKQNATNKTSSPTTINTSTSPTPATKSSALTATLIYTEVKDIITNTNTSRNYEVVNIYRKTGSGKPELLATVGKDNEQPGEMVLSPDKKTLYINLESKLQTLDLSSKTLTTLFTPKKQIFGFTFSPDGSRLLIWDQIYAPTDKDYAYFVHDFNIATKSDTILTQGTNEQTQYPINWRKDNKVLLGVPHGEFSTYASFDLATKKITPIEHTFVGGITSDDGTKMASANTNIEDICNSFGGDAPSTYKIIDPMTAKEYATIGSSTKRVSILAFSPDNKSIAYYEQPQRTTQADCSVDQPKTFYVASTDSTTSSTLVKDIDSLLNSWGLGEYAYESSKDGKVWEIYEQGKVTISSNKTLRVVATY